MVINVEKTPKSNNNILELRFMISHTVCYPLVVIIRVPLFISFVHVAAWLDLLNLLCWAVVIYSNYQLLWMLLLFSWGDELNYIFSLTFRDIYHLNGVRKQCLLSTHIQYWKCTQVVLNFTSFPPETMLTLAIGKILRLSRTFEIRIENSINKFVK